MANLFLVEYNGRPSSDYFHCSICGTRVAFVKDYIEIDVEPTFVPQGIFTEMFNVEVAEHESYHQIVDGKTLSDTCCVKCRDWLGWKFIAVPQGSCYEEGQFLMMLDKLSYSNGQLLAPIDQAGGTNEQDLVANEENVDQDGGANEEKADQDGSGDQQVPNGHI